MNVGAAALTTSPTIYALKTTGAITGSGTITINSGGMILGGSVAPNIAVPNGVEAVVIPTAATTLSGSLTLPSGLHVGGGSALTINGSGNSVAGNLTIDNGATVITPFESPVGSGNSPISGFSNIVLNGGTLSNGITTQTSGSGLPANQAIVLGSLGGTITDATTANVTFSIASQITGSGALTLSPANGNVQISVTGSSNSYTGGTNIVGGATNDPIFVTSTGTLGSGPVTIRQDPDQGPAVALNLQGDYNLTNNASGGTPTGYAPLEVDPGQTAAFTSNNPQMGSLSGGGIIRVGNLNANDTNLTVGLDNGSSSFLGFITQASSNSGAGVGSLIKAGTGTFNIYGVQQYTGSTTVNAGTLVVDGTLVAAGRTNVNGGKLVLGSVNAFPANTNLSIATGAQVTVATHGSSVDFVPLVSNLSNNGTIDITNNAMVLQNASIGTVNSAVAMAYNNGSWTGTNASNGVITGSTAAADATHLTAVGVATNLTSFEGSSVSPSAVLVKYTFYGDANLSGSVDGSDYSRIDNAYLQDQTTATAYTGWQNGDFNYDGVIDGSDYTLIDNAFNSQGAEIAALIASPTASVTDQIAVGSGNPSVPEPTALGLLAIGACGLLGRRRASPRH